MAAWAGSQHRRPSPEHPIFGAGEFSPPTTRLLRRRIFIAPRIACCGGEFHRPYDRGLRRANFHSPLRTSWRRANFHSPLRIEAAAGELFAPRIDLLRRANFHSPLRIGLRGRIFTALTKSVPCLVRADNPPAATAHGAARRRSSGSQPSECLTIFRFLKTGGIRQANFSGCAGEFYESKGVHMLGSGRAGDGRSCLQEFFTDRNWFHLVNFVRSMGSDNVCRHNVQEADCSGFVVGRSAGEQSGRRDPRKRVVRGRMCRLRRSSEWRNAGCCLGGRI